MDRIIIKDLVATCIIGANEGERHQKQQVVVNLVIWADLSRAATTDLLSDTIDYRELRDSIMETIQNSNYFLVEALAESIAKVCLREPRIEQVQVTVEKPGALTSARSVGIEILRKRT